MIKAETNNELNFKILDNIDAILLVADSNGNIVFANKAIHRILGYSPDKLLGDGWWNLTKNKMNTDDRKSTVADMASGNLDIKNRHLFENAIPTKDGRIVWTQWTNTRTSDGFIIGIAQDITEKKELELKLQLKNIENELLLKEIHHRVKNNLQIISSILSLQFSHINDQAVIKALANCKGRIASMGLVHYQLLESENISSINFKNYITKLAENISYSYIQDRSISTQINCDNVFFSYDLLVNLGLIINEILTNAYKHAFTDQENGIIEITLKLKEANNYQLLVKDNGKGMDLREETQGSKSLGFDIIQGLSEQIKGSLKIENNNGLIYSLEFSQPI
jgi:PAS domain S-box-containing protein